MLEQQERQEQSWNTSACVASATSTARPSAPPASEPWACSGLPLFFFGGFVTLALAGNSPWRAGHASPRSKAFKHSSFPHSCRVGQFECV